MCCTMGESRSTVGSTSWMRLMRLFRPARSEMTKEREFPTASGRMCSKVLGFFSTPSMCMPPLWAKALRTT